MTVQAKQIFEEALGLPANEKALLAEQLLASLDFSSSKSIDEMWARESENRIDAYERGEMKAIPADEVFKKIRDDMILVVAVMHLHREPNYWKSRISDTKE